jgi:CarD family transcriptional regulator
MKAPAAAVVSAKTAPARSAAAGEKPARPVGKARIATAAPPDATPPARKPATKPAAPPVAKNAAPNSAPAVVKSAGSAKAAAPVPVRPASSPAIAKPAAPPERPAKAIAKSIEVQTLQSTPAETASAEPVETADVVAAPSPTPMPAPIPAPRPMEPRLSVPQGPNGRPAPISRASNKDETFSEGDYVVYPTHGVGRVEKIASEDIAGHTLQLIHITFEENRMTLRVPVSKARSAGLRRLSTRKMFDDALAVLKGRARIKRTMWSRRAQEYEAKINSGDPVAIAEVVRDLHRNAGQPDQSFSERQIYEAALDRLGAELAALDLTDKNAAMTKLAGLLKPA